MTENSMLRTIQSELGGQDSLLNDIRLRCFAANRSTEDHNNFLGNLLDLVDSSAFSRREFPSRQKRGTRPGRTPCRKDRRSRGRARHPPRRETGDIAAARYPAEGSMIRKSRPLRSRCATSRTTTRSSRSKQTISPQRTNAYAIKTRHYCPSSTPHARSVT